jgi:hypothetical protein
LEITRPKKPRVKPSFGWKLSDEGRLIPHVREQKIVKRIVQLSARGLSPTRIAKFLSAKGIPTKTKKRWEHKTIQAILEREGRRKDNAGENIRCDSGPGVHSHDRV